MPQDLARSLPRVLGTFALMALLVVLILLPAYLALGELGLSELQPAYVAGSLAALLLLAILPSVISSWFAAALAALVLALMLFIRLWFFGLVQFSGAGFTNEVFIHLELRSVELAWEQYRGLFLVLLAVLATIPFVTLMLVRRARRVSGKVALALAVLALAGFALTRHAQPEWMLGEAAYIWYSPKRLDMPEAELQRWRDSGLVEVDLLEKSSLQASASTPPRNLILVYLESVGLRVIDHPDYPGLMPNLSRRLKTQNYVPNFFAGSYITIEGITNTQCGTLFPFERGSDSLAGFDGMAEQQACLGDVLAKAGYVQSYLGGAEASFAGKGSFLKAHGYDAVKGFAHWEEIGLSRRPGGWGLGDPDLFEQAFLELEALRAGERPFNLTLLTIGTHLPGFTYAECRPYGSELFIEALHCTDQLLEQWLERLEDAGYLEDSIVVVTGDHHLFPNPEMRRLFGDDAVRDKRLPLLVLGANASQRAVVDAGMNYDLAPTLLDLLGVEHNAVFALGRSLLREEARRDYFPTRYQDVYAGQYARIPPGDCDTGPPVLPLRRCEKDALLTLLRMQNDALSVASVSKLDCRHASRTRIRIPDASDTALQFIIDGQDQAARFTWRARPDRETLKGLFTAVFSPDGVLAERRFTPEAEQKLLADLPVVPAGHSMLIAWSGSPEGATPPHWLQPIDESLPRLVVFVDSQGQIQPLSPQRGSDSTEYAFDQEVCVNAFE